MAMSFTRPVIAHGKKLLIKAALKLAVHTRSVRAIGVREIGREAGLNPNTFYRHFSNMDDLGLAMLETVVNELRQPLHEMRLKAAASVRPSDLSTEARTNEIVLSAERARLVRRETVRLFFDFVTANPEAFIVGVSELHGASPALRAALRKTLDDFAEDMAKDLISLNLLPLLDDAMILRITKIIIDNMFHLSTEYIEHPDQRDAIRSRADTMIILLVAGAIGLNGPDLPSTLEYLRIMRHEEPKTT